MSNTCLCFACPQFVCNKLMEVYGLQCSVKNILTLESSTEEKFSQHLIFNLQNAVFKDNTHVGMFQVTWRQPKTFFLKICILICPIIHCVLGGFIHAALQPALIKARHGGGPDAGIYPEAENGETRFVLFRTVMHKLWSLSSSSLNPWCSDTEHVLLLREKQKKWMRSLKVLRPRDASRKRQTWVSSRWKTRTARTVSLLILVRQTTLQIILCDPD